MHWDPDASEVSGEAVLGSCAARDDPCCAMQEFVKQHGSVESPGGFRPTNMDDSVEGRAMGFTCAQVTVVDFASDVTWYSSHSDAASGTLYRLVRGDVAECHSDRESVMRMACINKAVIKSCSMMKVEMEASNTYADTAAAQAAWDVVQKEKFEEVASPHI